MIMALATRQHGHMLDSRHWLAAAALGDRCVICLVVFLPGSAWAIETRQHEHMLDSRLWLAATAPETDAFSCPG